MRWLVSFMAWALVASVADVCPASAQESGRVYRVGWLELGGENWRHVPMETWTGRGGAFRDALRDSGFILGENLVVEYRVAYGDVTRLAAEVESLVAAATLRASAPAPLRATI